MKLVSIFILLFCSQAFAFEAEVMLDDTAKEAQARELFHEYKCVVCAGQSLAESNAELARSMRSTIRTQLQEGKTAAQVRVFLEARYGVGVRLDPPFEPTTLMLWLAPFLAIFAGVLIIYRTAKR